jgi:hypothetical protein
MSGVADVNFADNIKGGDFPYNVSWNGDVKVGGSTMSADFSASLFAGKIELYYYYYYYSKF